MSDETPYIPKVDIHDPPASTGPFAWWCRLMHWDEGAMTVLYHVPPVLRCEECGRIHRPRLTTDPPYV